MIIGYARVSTDDQNLDAQTDAYKNDLLGGDDILRVSIEAGTTFGWERYTGLNGLNFGIDSFGASAPINDLYDHFGLTAEKITPQILEKVGEESVESIIAAKDYAVHASLENKHDLIYEVADLWFHSIVMLGYFDLDPQVVLDELARRQGLSGLVEKANRSKEA